MDFFYKPRALHFAHLHHFGMDIHPLPAELLTVFILIYTIIHGMYDS